MTTPELTVFARSVVYESSCALCHPGGNREKKGGDTLQSGVGLYIGRTSRLVCERIGEHVDDATSFDRDSFSLSLSSGS